MGKIVAVVVTYNRSNLLVECVEALMNSGTATDILVIDNASTDNTHEVIAPYIDNKKIFYFIFKAYDNKVGTGFSFFCINK